MTTTKPAARSKKTPKAPALIRLNVDAFNDHCATFEKAPGVPVTSFRDQAKLLNVDATSVYRSRTGGALGSKMLSAMARTFGMEKLTDLLVLK
jgi:hypothetical protein